VTIRKVAGFKYYSECTHLLTGIQDRVTLLRLWKKWQFGEGH